MWSKSRDQETAPAIQPNPSAQAPAPEVSRRDTTMPSPTRTTDLDAGTARGISHAMLGTNVTIKGQIFSRGDLTIEGEVEGSIECPEHLLTIGANARVDAGMKAREIVIHGNIQGNIEAVEKVDIRKGAGLVGDIKTARITIEDGAYLKGSIDISKVSPAARTDATPLLARPATDTAPRYSAGSQIASARISRAAF